MRSWHERVCNEISYKTLKVVLQTNNHKHFEKKHYWKASRRNNDNDAGTFVMLNYGRNKMTFCGFHGHERLKKVFWASLFSLWESLHHILLL